MTEKTIVPVPKALQELIRVNNQLLQQYQNELTSKVFAANEEMMQLLGLDPNDGWRVDIDEMMYVKIPNSDIINDT